MPDLASGLIYYLVFLFSTSLHEAGHAWAAKRGGDLTAYHGGQVSLDPIPHIRREPFGMVVLPLISVVVSGWPFGFASAPYSVAWARAHPKRAAWMALAGPAGNMVLMVIAILAIRMGGMVGVFDAPDSIVFDRVVRSAEPGMWSSIAFLLSVIFSLNLLLFIFNLFPLPPLDGSGAVPLFMSKEGAARYQEAIWSRPGLGWIGILIAWQLFDYIYHPVWLLIVNLMHPGVSYGEWIARRAGCPPGKLTRRPGDSRPPHLGSAAAAAATATVPILGAHDSSSFVWSPGCLHVGINRSYLGRRPDYTAAHPFRRERAVAGPDPGNNRIWDHQLCH